MSSKFILSDAIVWDAHTCPSYSINSDLSAIFDFFDSGYSFISINIGFEASTQENILNLANYIREYIAQHNDKLALTKTVTDIEEAKKSRKLGIAFDIESYKNIGNNINDLDMFYDAGVRQMSLTYNKNNLMGGGCQDTDINLTNLGQYYVNKLDSLGMLIDCSHVSYKTSLDVINTSSNPVVFSHSNPYHLSSHERNIKDKQITECSKRGGVIGINGINLFLQDRVLSPSKIVDCIDYIVDLTSIDNVGLGFDYLFELNETLKLLDKFPEQFPNPEQYRTLRMASPYMLTDIIEELTKRAYSESNIKQILGGNFFRVANTVWKS